jgi:hypothetical protein
MLKHRTNLTNKRKYIKQTDITSTLSVLLDIPIPSNSIGYPIVELLPERFVYNLGEINTNIMKHYSKLIEFHNLQISSKCQMGEIRKD